MSAPRFPLMQHAYADEAKAQAQAAAMYDTLSRLLDDAGCMRAREAIVAQVVRYGASNSDSDIDKARDALLEMDEDEALQQLNEDEGLQQREEGKQQHSDDSPQPALPVIVADIPTSEHEAAEAEQAAQPQLAGTEAALSAPAVAASLPAGLQEDTPSVDVLPAAAATGAAAAPPPAAAAPSAAAAAPTAPAGEPSAKELGRVLDWAYSCSDHIIRRDLHGSAYDERFPGSLVTEFQSDETKHQFPVSLVWAFDETAYKQRHNMQSLPAWQKLLPLLPFWTLGVLGDGDCVMHSCLLADVKLPIAQHEFASSFSADQAFFQRANHLATTVQQAARDPVTGWVMEESKKEVVDALQDYRAMSVSRVQRYKSRSD